MDLKFCEDESIRSLQKVIKENVPKIPQILESCQGIGVLQKRSQKQLLKLQILLNIPSKVFERYNHGQNIWDFRENPWNFETTRDLLASIMSLRIEEFQRASFKIDLRLWTFVS